MSKPPTVPYCTVKGFRTCLEGLRRQPAEALDRQALVERGLSSHAAYPVLGALRFLGLVDDSGRVMPTIDAFLTDDLAGRRVLVEAAYADVLRDVRFPVEDREDVDRLLVERHGVAAGVAPFCSTLFLWLAAESGLPVADVSRHRRGRPPAHLASLSAAALQSLRGGPPPRTDGRMPLDGSWAEEVARTRAPHADARPDVARPGNG